MELLPLVCLCLLSCSGDAVRVVVEQDSDAVLPCLISTEEDISYQFFDWRKDGQKEVFKYDAGIHYNNDLPGQDDQFKSRVSFFQDQLENGNASIKITRTKMADSGNYSCDFPRHQQRQTSIIELVVDRVLKDRRGENITGASSKPYVRTVITDDGVILQCEVLGASPKPKVEWKDSSGNILQTEEPQVTESGGGYDIVLRAAVTKTDTFRCVVTQEEISHQTEAETYASVSGAAPKPYISTLRDTKYWRLLLCEARGVPPLTVEWKNAAGNILNSESTPKSETGSLSYIALNITVTKTDDYSCVATQKQFSHQIAAVTSVYIQVPPPEPGSSAGLFIGGVVCGLLVAAVAVVFYFKDRIRQICALGSRRNTANGPTGAELSANPMIDHSERL